MTERNDSNRTGTSAKRWWKPEVGRRGVLRTSHRAMSPWRQFLWQFRNWAIIAFVCSGLVQWTSRDSHWAGIAASVILLPGLLLSVRDLALNLESQRRSKS